jgi:hypothetical protein
MLIDEQNKARSVGRKPEAVVVWRRTGRRGEGARLLEQDKVAVVFGCWTSVS